MANKSKKDFNSVMKNNKDIPKIQVVEAEKTKKREKNLIIIIIPVFILIVIGVIKYIKYINDPYNIVSGYYTIPGSESSSLLSFVSLEETLGRHEIRIVHWYTKSSNTQLDYCTKNANGDAINCASEQIWTDYTATKNDKGDITIFFNYAGKNYTCEYEVVEDTRFLNCNNNLFGWTNKKSEEYKTVIDYK